MAERQDGKSRFKTIPCGTCGKPMKWEINPPEVRAWPMMMCQKCARAAQEGGDPF